MRPEATAPASSPWVADSPPALGSARLADPYGSNSVLPRRAQAPPPGEGGRHIHIKADATYVAVLQLRRGLTPSPRSYVAAHVGHVHRPARLLNPPGRNANGNGSPRARVGPWNASRCPWHATHNATVAAWTAVQTRVTSDSGPSCLCTSADRGKRGGGCPAPAPRTA